MKRISPSHLLAPILGFLFVAFFEVWTKLGVVGQGRLLGLVLIFTITWLYYRSKTKVRTAKKKA